MTRLVYKAAQGLKDSWNFATGVTMMKNRNIPQTDASVALQGIPLLAGGILGLMVGPIVGMETDSILTALEFGAAVTLLPPVGMHMTYALYKVGEQKEQQLLLTHESTKKIEAQPEQLQLPKPDVPLI